MKCSGLNAATGQAVEITFKKTILSVTPPARAEADLPFLAPGWIDLQVNGYAGVDFNDPAATHAEIALAIRALRACGVTRFFPTVVTGPFERMTGALRNLAAARESLSEGTSIEALHLEGPYVSPRDGPRGIHPREHVRPPDLAEFERLQRAAGGLIRIVTLSPEWPGAPEFIGSLAARGVVVSIGHTCATSEQILAAVDAGATMSTHLGNAADANIPRRSNYLWEQLAEDRLSAAFIVDGVHLSPAFLKVALRAKGAERSILVTDAAAPAGCEPGRHHLGELNVLLTEDGRIVLVDGSRLAASALSMDRALANLMTLMGLPLRDAVAMATVNPARVARIQGRRAGLAPGDRADLVQFRYEPGSHRIRIEKVFVGGEPCDNSLC
jgi:N-acetylglucosamine-6-phosphate deacetylase